MRPEAALVAVGIVAIGCAACQAGQGGDVSERGGVILHHCGLSGTGSAGSGRHGDRKGSQCSIFRDGEFAFEVAASGDAGVCFRDSEGDTGGAGYQRHRGEFLLRQFPRLGAGDTQADGGVIGGHHAA